ncbi:hypothetical protein K435DRAFT_781775, partial [Dendrothele bispora CBS 962.96]
MAFTRNETQTNPTPPVHYHIDFQPSHDSHRITTRIPSTPSISTSTTTTTADIRHMHITHIPTFPSYSASNQPNSTLPNPIRRSPYMRTHLH